MQVVTIISIMTTIISHTRTRKSMQPLSYVNPKP